ncbi:hypothetical protein HPP92_013735 [Vanilla planifolia]|uniref:Uncharacterized protein n=1 Tax=Vanilla planifolia TaxID=51239 RepID=A0A835QVF6_VANPL|nr:hypothetical protein HPP92_013735 [Vanilla planifolia]
MRREFNKEAKRRSQRVTNHDNAQQAGVDADSPPIESLLRAAPIRVLAFGRQLCFKFLLTILPPPIRLIPPPTINPPRRRLRHNPTPPISDIDGEGIQLPPVDEVVWGPETVEWAGPSGVEAEPWLPFSAPVK